MYPKATKKLIWLYILLGSILFGIVVGWLISWGVQVTHNVQVLHQDAKATSKEKFDASLEISKAIVSGIGTIATIIGGIVLYLNFRVANRNTELAESRLITESFSKAVEQLSNKDNLEVRLGGIYALERIAKDSTRDHWTIMEVLTAFVQEKSSHIDEKTQKRIPSYDTEIQAILNVLGRRDSVRKIGEQKLSLQGADLRGFTLTGNLVGIDLKDANLSDADLRGANLTNSDLRDANFADADLRGALLDKAKFNGAFLYNADFREAIFNETDFRNTHIRGAIFKGVNFKNSIFADSIFWDDADWEKRHWDDEQWQVYYYCEMEIKYASKQFDTEDEYDLPHKWRADFRQSNITIDQVRSAKEWEKAIYDKFLLKELGLPDYELDEVREEIS